MKAIRPKRAVSGTLAVVLLGAPWSLAVPCATDADCHDGDMCTFGICVSGVCEYVDAPDGTACDDGDVCTSDDVCIAGTCAGNSIPGCGSCVDDADCDDGNMCTDDFCDPVTGQCNNVNNTAACDDGNMCTENDTCTDGVCVGTWIPGCGACTSDADCYNGDMCTFGICVNGVCEYVDAPDGTACDDGDVCTDNDVCIAGTCTGNPIPGCGSCVDDADCDDGDMCTDDFCDPVTGQCNNVNNSAACDDGNMCTENDTCTDGVCVGTWIPGCGACTSDADCYNGDMCAIGICVSGVCEYVDAPDGTACDDGDVCTSDDVCNAGECTGNPIPGCGSCVDDADCDDGNMCTDDFCDPVTGQCNNVNNSAACDDGNACTENDTCTDGVCVGTWIPGCGACTSDADCYNGDMCAIGICVSGVCEYVDAPDGTACDDGDVCTDNDVCTAGICTGNPIPGCGSCVDDADCDDGDACTLDACTDGVCQHALIDSDECQGASHNPEMPTVSEWGIVVTLLLLVVAGTLVFGRRETLHI